MRVKTYDKLYQVNDSKFRIIEENRTHAVKFRKASLNEHKQNHNWPYKLE